MLLAPDPGTIIDDRASENDTPASSTSPISPSPGYLSISSLATSAKKGVGGRGE